MPFFSSGPGNPAVLSWDVPSRIGASYTSVKFEGPNGVSFAKGNMKAIQGQYVGDRLAIGAAGAKMDVAVDPIVGGGSLVERFSQSAVALKAFDWFSVGAGQDFDKRTAQTNIENSRASLGGLTLRLGGMVYLGAAKGTDAVEKGTTLPLPESKRDITRYGAGIHWVGASAAVHVEAYKEDRAAATTPVLVDSRTVRGAGLRRVPRRGHLDSRTIRTPGRPRERPRACRMRGLP